MPAVERVELPLRGEDDAAVGSFVITRIDGELKCCDDSDAVVGMERIQLVEHGEYAYAVQHSSGDVRIAIEPREIFSPDSALGTRGRIRVGLNTGRLALKVRIGSRSCNEIAVEVRSIKLGYENDYRSMLDDIATLATDLVLRRFGAAEQRLATDDARDATMLYQRFAFVRSLVMNETFTSAVRRVLSTPYVDWLAETEHVSASRGFRGSGNVGRALSATGERAAWPQAPSHLPPSIPRILPNTSFSERMDNAPNRFVRHVLEAWRGLAEEVVDRLQEVVATNVTERGIAEARELLFRLDDYLRHPVMANVGRLEEFPASNQVLQRREGYREVFVAYIRSLFAAHLWWKGAGDVYGAGQRDVATLYEYWGFLQLARALADLSGDHGAMEALVARTRKAAGEDVDQFTLKLARGEMSTIRYRARRGASDVIATLWFNREFRPSGLDGGTWTRTLRPDYTIEVALQDAPSWHEPLRLHFDAKYRIDTLAGAVGDADATGPTPESLLTMHTYRDAIFGAIGAYVLFPGDAASVKQKYREIVPGVGAFPLRPGDDAEESGLAEVTAFLGKALDHVAAHATRQTRARYWEARAYDGPANTVRQPVERWLAAPPADTTVLLGYVKNEQHLAWIKETRLYNLRADERSGAVAMDAAELRASLVLLYGPCLADDTILMAVTGAPLLMTKERMHELAYPQCRGSLYFCLPLVSVIVQHSVPRAIVERVRGDVRLGAPRSVSWLELCKPTRA